MRLFASMGGVPADDRILAPALMLYSHAVELLFKSVFQRIEFKDGPVSSNPALDALLTKKYKHDLRKIQSDIRKQAGVEEIPLQLDTDVVELLDLLTQKHFLSVVLRYGTDSPNDYEDSFALVGLHGGLNQAWVKLYTYVDAVVEGALRARG